MHFNPAWLKAGKRSKEEAEKALAGWLEQQSYIQKAYTRTELLNDTISRTDPIAQAVRRSFHPERSGDVLFVVKPYCFLSPYLTGTTHGSPHSYDTHVPLLVFGAGVKAAGAGRTDHTANHGRHPGARPRCAAAR